jgi:hypothetical protein
VDRDKVLVLELDHLSAEAGAALLAARGAKGQKDDLRAAAREYMGHSLALTLLGTYLRKRHHGDIGKRAHIPLLEGKPAQRMMAIYERWFEDTPELAILRMLGLFHRPAHEDEIKALRRPPAVVGLTDALHVESKKKWFHILSRPPRQPLPEDAWNQAVTALRDVGLLAESGEAEEHGRLDAHPLVRVYFGDQLRQTHPAAWREGHRRLYEHLKKKAKPRPDTIEEMAPLYAAVVHGCLAGKPQEAAVGVYRARIQRGDDYFNWHRLGAFGSEVEILSAFFDPPWDRLAPGLSEEDGPVVLSAAGFALQAVG